MSLPPSRWHRSGDVTPAASVRAIIARSGSAAGRNRRAQLTAAFRRISTSDLPERWPAPLRHALIFDPDGHAASDPNSRTVRLDVHRFAKAGVGIDDERDLNAARRWRNAVLIANSLSVNSPTSGKAGHGQA